MKRSEFLCSAAAVGASWVGLGQAKINAQSDLASAQRALGEHRIARMESRCSDDRYSHFVGLGRQKT